MPTLTAGLGALIVLVLYSLLGSRTFCGWICPMNIVADAAEWLRVRLELKADVVRISNKVRYGLLAAALILSAATGTAAFEAVSPQAWIWRDLVFGTGLGRPPAASAVFALDLALMKHGWCGHLCPLGAFWSLVGRLTRSPVVRVSFDDGSQPLRRLPARLSRTPRHPLRQPEGNGPHSRRRLPQLRPLHLGLRRKRAQVPHRPRPQDQDFLRYPSRRKPS